MPQSVKRSAPSRPTPAPGGSPGFALVIALALMAFILLLLLSITSLVRVESTSSDIAMRRLAAEQNALLGLRLAMGRMQGAVGPDQVATAQAALAHDPAVPGLQTEWLGVWNSDPDAPVFGRQSAWLVSGKPEAFAPDGEPRPAGGVETVGFGDLLPEPRGGGTAIEVPEERFGDNGAQRFGYFVADESLKAQAHIPVTTDRAALPPEDVSSRSLLSAPAGPAPEFGDPAAPIWGPGGDAERLRRLNRMTAAYGPYTGLSPDLSATSDDDRQWLTHRLTAGSLGLQANARNGGLRTDLSIAFEKDGGTRDPTALTWFTGPDSEFTGPGAPNSAPQVFPWEGAHQRFLFKVPFGGGAVRGPPWHLLRDHYIAHHELDDANPELGYRAPIPTGAQLKDRYDYNWWYNSQVGTFHLQLASDLTDESDFIRSGGIYAPRLLRHIFYFSLFRTPDGNLSIALKPVVVYWNPYDVPLRWENLRMSHVNIPFVFRVTVGRSGPSGGTERYMTTLGILLQERNTTNTALNVVTRNPDDAVLEPGEIKVFSLDNGNVNATPSSDGANKKGSVYLMEVFEGLRPTDAGIFFDRLPLVEGGFAHSNTEFRRPNDAITDDATEALTLVPFTDANGNTINSVSIEFGPAATFNDDGTLNEPLNISGGNNKFDQKGALTYKLTHTPENAPLNQIVPGSGDFIVNASQFGNAGLEGTAQNFGASALATPQAFGMLELTRRPALDAEAYPLLPGGSALGHVQTRQASGYPFPQSLPGWILAATTINDLGPNMPQTDSGNAFWGNSLAINGQSHVPLRSVPVRPMTALAEFQHAPVDWLGYHPTHAIGNSWATPFLQDTDALVQSIPVSNGSEVVYDLSYLANDALWDGYFFSGLAPFAGETLDDRIDAWVAGEPSWNPAMRPLGDPAAANLKASDGHRRIASHLLTEGAFNANTTDWRVWAAHLSRMRNRPAAYFAEGAWQEAAGADATLYARNGVPNGPAGEFWRGLRALDDTEIETLARAIADEVRARGPFLSRAAFVNRDPEATEAEHRRFGALQAAIEASGINDAVRSASGQSYDGDFNGDLQNPAAVPDQTATGITADISQADLLTRLGPGLTTRGDTFTIWVRGEASSGFDGDTVSAYGRAVVQRLPEFANPDANAALDPPDAWSPFNADWGRRLRLIAFEWVEPPS